MDKLDLPKRIRFARETLGLTQQAFADVLNVNLVRIISLENGKAAKLKIIELDKLEKLSFSKHWLLTGEGEMFAEKDNVHQNQSGSNNIQVGGNMGNIDRPTPTQQTQIPKNQYCIEDEEVAALCFSAYTSAKALGKVDKLKLYLASAVPEILK